MGATCRMCADGNKGLARVGEAVMLGVVEDACYVLGVHASAFPKPFHLAPTTYSNRHVLTFVNQRISTQHSKSYCMLPR